MSSRRWPSQPTRRPGPQPRVAAGAAPAEERRSRAEEQDSGRGGLYGSDTSGGPRAAVAELIGTFILVFAGIAVASAALIDRPTAGAPYDSLAYPAGPAGVGQALVVEVLITFILVFIIMSVATDERAEGGATAPLAVGFALAVSSSADRSPAARSTRPVR